MNDLLFSLVLCLAAIALLFALSVLGGMVLAWWLSPPAPARFIGWQPLLDGNRAALFTLTADIPGHPRESTVSAQTLERAGFRVPRQFSQEQP